MIPTLMGWLAAILYAAAVRLASSTADYAPACLLASVICFGMFVGRAPIGRWHGAKVLMLWGLDLLLIALLWESRYCLADANSREGCEVDFSHNEEYGSTGCPPLVLADAGSAVVAAAAGRDAVIGERKKEMP